MANRCIISHTWHQNMSVKTITTSNISNEAR